MNQRIHFTSVKQSDLKFLRDLPLFKDLGGEQVFVYEVTKFAGFQADDDHLDRYTETLKSKLGRVRKEAVETDFSMLESVPFTSNALQCLVELDGKIKYRSVFLTLANSSTETNDEFPLLLVSKCPKSVVKAVHDIIEMMFSCCIKDYKLHQEEVHWISAIGINELLRRRINNGLMITYSSPKVFQNGYVHAYASDDLILHLWHTYLYNQENRLSLESIRSMFSNLDQHLINTYGIDFSSCQIRQIVLGEINLKCLSTLHIKVGKPEILYIILIYLHSLIYERKGGMFELE